MNNTKLIRQMYNSEDAATEEEHRDTLLRILMDASEARAYVEVATALAPTDPHFSEIYRRFKEKVPLTRSELDKQLNDDAFALECGRHLIAIMETMKPGSMLGSLIGERNVPPPSAARVQRGRQSVKKANSA